MTNWAANVTLKPMTQLLPKGGGGDHPAREAHRWRVSVVAHHFHHRLRWPADGGGPEPVVAMKWNLTTAF